MDKSQGKGGSEHQNKQGLSHLKKPLYYMWQSHVEIEDYSVAYFDAFLCLKHRITELPLRDRERRTGVGTGREAERQGQKDRGKDGERDSETGTEGQRQSDRFRGTRSGTGAEGQ